MHRDFKPANVLVGLEGRVRVTDFGLSRPGAGPALMELPPMASPLVTREGTLVGTLVYMSPEQLDGKPATELSDQFSFCVSLAEALSGVRPFEGQSWSELAVSQANTPALPKSIPASVRAVLRKGLSAHPEKRYASMTTMLNALAQDEMKWVLAAARDIVEGTVVDYEMLVQRQMPAEFVTTSLVSPDSTSFIIGQRTNVSIQKGDTLLSTNFETSRHTDLAAPTPLPGSGSPAEGFARCKSSSASV